MEYIREYIYVDNKAVNSLLAQFDGGLNTLTTKIHQLSKNESVTDSTSKTSGLEAGGNIPVMAKASASYNINHTGSTEKADGELIQDNDNIVYDDFAVEVLEDYLKNGFTSVNEASPGDFINFASSFSLYDFNSMNAGLSVDKIDAVLGINSDDETTKTQVAKMKTELRQQRARLKKTHNAESEEIIQKVEKAIAQAESSLKESESAKQNFANVFAITNYIANALPNCVIISTPDILMYCQKDAFRLSSAQLQMLQKSPRPLHVLGIVEGIFSDVDFNNALIGTQLPPSEIGAITTYLTSMVLDNFGINQSENSLKVRPIALYF